ncbi:LMBR1-like membrane protein [Raphanus sativus]|nr:LMBR1-like membrane protein [Raphanus sativus]
MFQGFEDAGDFTVSERLKTSVHVNLAFYLVLGLILLIMNWFNDLEKKERTWLEEGQKVGELVLPLARNFNDVDDIEPGSNFSQEHYSVEMKMLSSHDTIKRSSYISRKYGSAREAITKKYAAIREQHNRYSLSPVTKSENMASAPSNGQGGSGVTFSR